MQSIGVLKRTAAQAAYGHLLPQGEKERSSRLNRFNQISSRFGAQPIFRLEGQAGPAVKYRLTARRAKREQEAGSHELCTDRGIGRHSDLSRRRLSVGQADRGAWRNQFEESPWHGQPGSHHHSERSNRRG